MGKYYNEFESHTFIPNPQHIKQGVVKNFGQKAQGMSYSKFYTESNTILKLFFLGRTSPDF